MKWLVLVLAFIVTPVYADGANPQVNKCETDRLVVEKDGTITTQLTRTCKDTPLYNVEQCQVYTWDSGSPNWGIKNYVMCNWSESMALEWALTNLRPGVTIKWSEGGRTGEITIIKNLPLTDCGHARKVILESPYRDPKIYTMCSSRDGWKAYR